MATDDDKLQFSTDWDIDQLVDSGSMDVASGTTTIYTLPDAGFPPVFEVHANFDSAWHQPGTNSNNHYLHAFVSGSSLRVTVNVACTVRYWIWSDKITY
jgi:hypothetical protein